MLADIIHQIAMETQDQHQLYRPRPSLSGPERCIRSLVYHASCVTPRPFPGRAMLTFDDSSWHEILTADWIRKTAYQIHSEQMGIDTPVGKGNIDGILTDPLGIDRLYEHKAINHFSFERIWKKEWPLDYITQVGLYIAGIQKIQPDINEGLLLIKNKNQAQYMELRMVYDNQDDSITLVEMVRSDGKQEILRVRFERITENAVEKFSRVELYIANNILPDRPFEYGTVFPCSYCRWGKTCWTNYEAEFEALSKDVALSNEIATAARFYKELGAQESEIKKQREEVKTSLKLALIGAGASSGKAGEYLIEIKQTKRKVVDMEKVPADAISEEISERLNVKNLKARGEQ